MEEDNLVRFKEIIFEIQRYNKLKLIGYITLPIIIGILIIRHANKKLAQLNEIKEQILKNLESSITEKIKDIEETYNKILTTDSYLIYSEKTQYLNKITNLIESINFVLKNKDFIPDKILILGEIAIQKSKTILNEINNFNKQFIERRKKEYSYLFKKDNLVLDNDQQTAVITDDKHNLVVAGAGSGKTEVLITRIAYLIHRKPDTIKPNRILALAFQNKAAYEIKERLKRRYNIDVEIRTFHSLGNKVIEDFANYMGRRPPELKLECSEDWKYQRYIQKIFDEEITQNKVLQDEIISYMKYYGDSEIIKGETDFETKEEYYDYQRNLTYTALDGAEVRSEAERSIKNFFFMHDLNGSKIRVIHEDPAPWMKYRDKNGKEHTPKPDFYFPDFDIYLEHWAINNKGRVPKWFSGEDPTKEYIEHMNLKKKQFEVNKKALIETTQADFEEQTFYEFLEKKFLETLRTKFPDQNFEIKSLSYNELVERVWEECKESVDALSLNISRFIVIAKTYSLEPSDINTRLVNERWSPRQITFAKIANRLYENYQRELTEGNYVDYCDMINQAVKTLKDNMNFYTDIYDHILIDEYQDISTQRYDLIRELMKKNSQCKLFCVGDDWQSIMGFAGANLDFFVNFDKYFDHPARTDLTKNYRSIKSIVDVGACIIKKNKEGLLNKKTVSHSNEYHPILVYSSLHQKKFRKQYYEQIAKLCLEKIKEYHSTKGYSYDEFMILLRITKKPTFAKILDLAKEYEIPISDNFDKPNCVHIMSVHKSKGLQARVVFILNVDEDLYGFPCELENPEIFEPAIINHKMIREEEERRLFYVAVTRAKEEVIMYTQKYSESKFITEIDEFVNYNEIGY